MRGANVGVAGIALVLALTGCSSEPQKAEGSFDYVDAPQLSPLTLPTTMLRPDGGDHYVIPEVTATSGELGDRVWIEPPLQVVPSAEGSSVVEGVDRYAVRFELLEGDGDLHRDTWQSIWEFFAHNGLKGRFWDKQEGVIITDWQTVDLTEKEGFWASINPFHDTPPQTTLRQRFAFSLDVAPHGRSATLGAALLGAELSVNGAPRAEPIREEEKRDYVVGILNAAVKYYESKQRLTRKESKDQTRSFPMTLGHDHSGVPIFVVGAGFNRVWSALPLVLEKTGFEITDRDKTKGTFFVKYVGTVGFWASLFGSDDMLPLERDKYQILVGELADQQTSITILDEDNRPLREEVASKVMAVFSQILSERPN